MSKLYQLSYSLLSFHGDTVSHFSSKQNLILQVFYLTRVEFCATHLCSSADTFL